MNYNHFSLLGRISTELATDFEGERRRTLFEIQVQRPDRDYQGNHEKDEVPIVTYGSLAKKASEHLKNGDSVLLDGAINVVRNEKNESITQVVAGNFQII